MLSGMTAPAEPAECEGWSLFVEWLRQPGNSQAAVAKALGVSGPSVHAWATRVARPQAHLRGPLEEFTRGFIPASSWETHAEREARERALARIRASAEGSAPDSDP